MRDFASVRIMTTYQNTQANQFKNYIELLRWRAQKDGKALSYFFLEGGKTEGEQFSFEELDDRVRSVAAYLQILNAENERVLLILESNLSYVVAFFACLYSKSVAVTLHPPFSKEQLLRIQQVINDCKPKFVLATSATTDSLSAYAAWKDQDIEWVKIDKIPFQLASCWHMPSVEPNDVAFLQYTSGSTASPKGVMVSHRNLLCQGEYMQQAMSMTQQDCAVMWLPHFHDMGLIMGILQGTYTKYPTYIMTPLSFIKNPLNWLKALSKYQATFTAAPNFAYDLCCEAFNEEEAIDLDLSHLTCALNGAEPLRKKTLDRFSQIFAPYGFNYRAFYPAYGMAEATLVISGGNRQDPPITAYVDPKKLAAHQAYLVEPSQNATAIMGCGHVHLDTVLKIAHPNTSKICANFEVGEIHVKGENVALGYWKHEAASKADFRVYLDGEGPFLRTGDLGFLDDNGELYISGRCKDIIIISGRNHAPQDIELTVQNCHQAIRDNFVGAVSIDRDGKEVLVIIAEVRQEHIKDLDSQAICQLICKQIAKIHEVQTEDILLIKRGQFPKTTSGKIQRSVCRSKYLNNEFKIIYQHRAQIGGNKAHVES